MADDKNSKWIVFVLKERFANDQDRDAMKASLLANFPLKSSDIYFVSEEDGTALNNFIFVKEYDAENDLRSILEFKREMLEAYPAHMRITEKELDMMVEGIGESKRKETVKHGDIVMIKSGIYNKLYGIVLRETRSSKLDVGLKFCFGTITEQYNPEDLNVIGNIFNYLKVLK